MKYLQKRFSVFLGGSKKYSENYDRIFKKSVNFNWLELTINKLQNIIKGKIK